MKRTPRFENLSTIYERVKKNISGRTIQPLFPSGLGGVDDITRGFPKGKVSIISSRSSEGKTSFSLQAAVHLASAGKTVAFISIEDDREQCVERILCNIFEIDNYDLHRGKLDVLEPKEQSAKYLFERLKFLMLDSYGYNFEEFKDVVMNMRPKPDIVFFDYIQMVEHKGGKKYEAISAFLNYTHQLAMQEKIAIVINSQINRGAAEAKRPHLHNLEWAGTLEQIAHMVIIIHTPAAHGDTSFNYSKRTGAGMKDPPIDYVELQIEKNKMGRKGIIPVRFIGKYFKFTEWI